MHQPIPLQESREPRPTSGSRPKALRVCAGPLSPSLSAGCLWQHLENNLDNNLDSNLDNNLWQQSCSWLLSSSSVVVFPMPRSLTCLGDKYLKFWNSFFCVLLSSYCSNAIHLLDKSPSRCQSPLCPTTSPLARMVLAAGEEELFLLRPSISSSSFSAPSCHRSPRTRQ